jgi:hypothetical protein
VRMLVVNIIRGGGLMAQTRSIIHGLGGTWGYNH